MKTHLMNMLALIAGFSSLSQDLARAAEASNVSTQTIFSCRQLITKSEFNSFYSVQDFVNKNSDNKRPSVRTWNMSSHFISVFAGGDQKTIISIDGVSNLNKIGTKGDKYKGEDFVKYSSNFGKNGFGSWGGANILFERELNDYMYNKGHMGYGKMLIQFSDEEGNRSTEVFYCDFGGSQTI